MLKVGNVGRCLMKIVFSFHAQSNNLRSLWGVGLAHV